MNRQIILASSSPRRIEMMKRHGYNPEIRPSDIDETLPDDISMKDAVMFLALKKALDVESRCTFPEDQGKLIIAADTVVYKDGILGKPLDRADAFDMLTRIKNTSHQVATGVAIIEAGCPNKVVFCDVTTVFCKDYTEEELHAYLDTDEPYDKAGAYAIQGIFAKHIDRYEGSFDTVVGFPWDMIESKLKAFAE
ncbi:MAG: septum formation protein Maf [Firmicutes bacterium]|nr:septum formation protein Maf [Bacillota bacterium]